MRAHTRKLHTEKIVQQDSKEDDKPMSADEMIQKICDKFPEWALALRGLRYREGLTQKQLGELVGIPQTNISQMELGKRSIGKHIAKKLASFFKTDYRLFL